MKSFKTNRIIFSVGAVLIGLILLIWPASSLMIIAKALGVLLAAGGIASGVFYFKDHQSIAKTALLVMGVIMIVCGAIKKKTNWGWINDYALPISLIGGMACAIPLTAWLG